MAGQFPQLDEIMGYRFNAEYAESVEKYKAPAYSALSALKN